MISLTKNTEVRFVEDGHHYYTKDGKELCGVTTMLRRQGLAPDYDAIDPEVLKAAAERGTWIHEQLENYDNGMPVVVDENVKAYQTLHLPVVESEYLISDNEHIASKIDKVLDDGSLVDVKTTSVVHTEYVTWQLSVYAYLFEMQNPALKVPSIYCAHIRDGKAKLIKLNRVDDVFVKALLRADADGEQFEKPELPVQTGSVISTIIEQYEAVEEAKLFIKQAEAKLKELYETIGEKMREEGVTELMCRGGKIVRSADYTRTTIDSARLKKDLPDIAEKYSKTTTVKGGVSYKPSKSL